MSQIPDFSKIPFAAPSNSIDAGALRTWTTPEGRRHTDDNPIFLANRKAKALSALLKAQPASRAVRVPFLEPLLFLSAPDLRCELAGAARNRVCLADRAADDPQGPRDGILAALLGRKVGGVEPVCRTSIDAKVARALTRAMDEAGHRITRFLMVQALINAIAGVSIGVGLLVLGVEYALLWGFLVFMLRYIPYVGIWFAALPPIGAADPQADATARLLRWLSHGALSVSPDDVGNARLLAMVVWPQLAGIAFMLAMAPWRHHRRPWPN